MTINEILKATGLSKAAFSKKFNIPVRTLESWSSGERRCPDYVMELLERCVTQSPLPLKDEPLPLKDLREEIDLSRTAFSEKYHIPLRTLENWERGIRSCPIYVAELLERCVRYDYLPVYFCVLEYPTWARESINAKGYTTILPGGRAIYLIYKNRRKKRCERGCTQMASKEFLTEEFGFSSKHECELELKHNKPKEGSPCEVTSFWYSDFHVMRYDELYKIISCFFENIKTPAKDLNIPTFSPLY